MELICWTTYHVLDGKRFEGETENVPATPGLSEVVDVEAGGWRDNLLSDWDEADAELFELINSEIRLDFKERVSLRSKSCDEKSKERRIQRSLMSNSMRNGTRRHHQDRQHHSSGINKLYTALT